jgi:hypothetical protein
MAKAKKRDSKSEALAQDGVLNPSPEAVHDALFAGNPFFDAKDLVQVRYEMVRRHRADGAISEAAAMFGAANLLQSQNALRALTPGLLPSRRGPKGGHRSPRGDSFVAALKAATSNDDFTVSRRSRALRRQVHRRSLGGRWRAKTIDPV